MLENSLHDVYAYEYSIRLERELVWHRSSTRLSIFVVYVDCYLAWLWWLLDDAKVGCFHHHYSPRHSSLVRRLISDRISPLPHCLRHHRRGLRRSSPICHHDLNFRHRSWLLFSLVFDEKWQWAVFSWSLLWSKANRLHVLKKTTNRCSSHLFLLLIVCVLILTGHWTTIGWPQLPFTRLLFVVGGWWENIRAILK